MLNFVERPLPTVYYSEAPDFIDLPRDIRIMAIYVRVLADVTIGAPGDGALTDSVDHVAKLLSELSLSYGTFPIISPDYDGPAHMAWDRYQSPHGTPQTRLANAGAQVATSVEANFAIEFALPGQVNGGINTALPHFPDGKDFRLNYRWNRDKTTAASSPGSAALVTGGTADVTLANVRMEIVVFGAKKLPKPWFLPVRTVQFSRTFQQAENDYDLPLTVGGDRLLAGAIVQYVSGANRARDNKITRISMITGNGERPIDDVTWSYLTRFERAHYAAKTTTYDNEHYFQFADGGKLTNALNLAALSSPYLRFDLGAPANAPGLIRVYRHELKTELGLTELPAPAGNATK